MKTIRLAPLCASLAIFSVGLFGASLEAAHPAKERLTVAVETVIEALFDEEARTLDADAQRARVRAVVDEQLDFSVIIRRAFGRNWQRLDDAQQGEVVDLITETLVTSYVKSFASSEPPEIAYGSVTEQGANRAEIASRVTTNGRTVQVLYRMGRLESGWEVMDVVAEGVSMVANYRQQLDNHFRRRDGDALLVRLREMAAKGEVEL